MIRAAKVPLPSPPFWGVRGERSLGSASLRRNLFDLSPKDELMPSSKPLVIFYAKKDAKGDEHKRWLNRIREYLDPRLDPELVEACSDRELDLMEDWQSHMQALLAGANLAVLLVSPAMLSSRYIRSSELPVMLMNAQKQGLRVMLVLIKASLYEETKFKYPDAETGPESLKLSVFDVIGSRDEALGEMQFIASDGAVLHVAQTMARYAKDSSRAATK